MRPRERTATRAHGQASGSWSTTGLVEITDRLLLWSEKLRSLRRMTKYVSQVFFRVKHVVIPTQSVPTGNYSIRHMQTRKQDIATSRVITIRECTTEQFKNLSHQYTFGPTQERNIDHGYLHGRLSGLSGSILYKARLDSSSDARRNMKRAFSSLP